MRSIVRTLLLTLAGTLCLTAPAGAATLIADYRFDDSLESSVPGAPPLANIGAGNTFAIETVKGQPNTVLTFPKGNGVHLPDTGAFFSGNFNRSDNYSLVFDLRLTSVDDTGLADYRRLLTWRTPSGPDSTDRGLYVLEKKLTWYRAPGDVSGASDVFAPDKYVQVAMTRVCCFPFGDAHFYTDGVSAVATSDDPTNITADGLRFFKDDDPQQGEESAGAVSRIRFYEGTLSAQEVAALAGTSDPPPPDDDGDGVFDHADNCKSTSNAGQADVDADGAGDACDTDDDGDGVADATDKCPSVPDPGQANADSDSQGDACDPDDDGDGVADESDKCPTAADAAQLDTDSDGLGDACDPDDDGDGVSDSSDGCPTSVVQVDTDRDGVHDACDPDDDGDGVPDAADACPALTHVGANGCPGAQIQRVGKVRTRRAGRRGIRVITGLRAVCPLGPLTCTVRGSVVRAKAGGSSAALRQLGRVKFALQPGGTKAIRIKLTKKGAAALRRARRMRVKIKVSATGPDGRAVTVTRTAAIKPPR